MSKPCCGNAPQVYIAGKWSCSECGSITQSEISKLIDEFTEWQLTSGAFKTPEVRGCECGAWKTSNANCHSTWCPRYVKP